ncbi:MAG: LLM class F420-dependent oxidoreductase [Ktedonobacteraceae bacterium]
MTQSNNTTRPIRIGVQLQPQHGTYQQFAEAVRHAEEMGVDTIFDWDHFFPLYGDPQGNHFEGWTLLTAMAMLTQRAEVGTLVTCNTYRNPALLADMAKTVDHISNGRLILGIGAGWFERDYTEYGYDFGTAGSRLEALEHSLQVIKHRWEVDIPKPVRKIPILVGGGGEKKTLRITATYADIWHGFGDPATYTHKVEVLNNWCAEVGRDPQEIEHAVGPQQVDTATLDAYVKAGATHLIVGLNAPWDLSKVAQVLKWRSERYR